MSKIQCIVIEDEPLAVKVLVDYIAHIPFLHLEGTFKDAILATDYLRDNFVDLIFLDIHLPKLKGMAFLRTLTRSPEVIVTTAYHKYALEGYDLNVTDYLLKPIEFERFLVSVNKVKTALIRDIRFPESQVKDFIFLNVQNRKVKISFSEIVYVESQREYIKMVTTRQTFISKMSTREIESILPPNLFKRIHRSYIVSVDKIESYTADKIEISGVSIPIGRSYKEVIKTLWP